MRQVNVDDVVLEGQRAHAGDRTPHVAERPLLGEDRAAPGDVAKAVLEVAARPVREGALDSGIAERIRELKSGGGGAGPAVRGDELQHSHRGNTS